MAASRDLKVALSKAVVSAYRYVTGLQLAGVECEMDKECYPLVRLSCRPREGDFFVTSFDIRRLLHCSGADCQQSNAVDGDTISKMLEHLNRSFCPSSAMFSLFSITPCGHLTSTLRRPTLFERSVRHALLESNDFGYFEGPKSVVVFAHFFPEPLRSQSGSAARTELLSMTAATIIAQSGIRPTVIVPQVQIEPCFQSCMLPTTSEIIVGLEQVNLLYVHRSYTA